MIATARLLHADARDLPTDLRAELVVTSPPYPMIEMWDRIFPSAADALARGDGPAAFEAMHRELDPCWKGLRRVLVEGGIACINIGDATRTIGGEFALYPNHARILAGMMAAGFQVLPDILWRKPNNSPTKFMGSGMLPPGAYVTYEHEYVLVFRKGGKRAPDAEARRRSAWFWEERNAWFSDLWQDLRGVDQGLDDAARKRSAAFPFELAWRLIQMFSVQGETVLDPFCGTGTTALAAVASGRHAIGLDQDSTLLEAAHAAMPRAVALGNDRVDARLGAHRAFVHGRDCKHRNDHYGFGVVTGQETELRFLRPLSARREGDAWTVELSEAPVAQGRLFA